MISSRSFTLLAIICWFASISSEAFAWYPSVVQLSRPAPKTRNSENSFMRSLRQATPLSGKHGVQQIWAKGGKGSLEEYHKVQVSYQGRSCDMFVQNGETLLSAMERTGTANQLALPSVPYDCRRGNCLTCTGKHIEGSEQSNLISGEDGLSPYMSKQAKERGYVLTCSSYVVGDGVKLNLGENDKAWKELYASRLEEESTQLAGREAMARVIRLYAEKNLPEWADETEKVLKQNSDD